jgi:type IV pilus biogenesis protein CpaD/CtpE
MKRLILIFAALTLSGCASITGLIPSFWDDNQSARIVDVRQKIDAVNCSQNQLAQAQAIQQDLRWFELYSESKGSRQQDVLRLIAPMQETTADWVKRAQDNQASVGYCEIKKKIMQTQAKTAAKAVLGRF